MSLHKKLWVSITLLMTLAFAGSFVVSCLSAQAYLEEQLYLKNIDNASSLALSISSEPRDEVMIELFINAQFDSGHYQFINLVDMNGKTIAAQFDKSLQNEAPRWLARLFPIKVKPGVAQVSNGWQQVGTLTLSSHTRFAYQQLWGNAKQLFYYFVLISLSCGVAGSVLLRILTTPLQQAVAHANAIGERRFIQTPEPKTFEFRSLITSLNRLSGHVKSMLEEESHKLEQWRKQNQHDEVTGLIKREAALSMLQSYLHKDDENAAGLIVLIRITDLFRLNQHEGRTNIDALLKQLGETLLGEAQGRHNKGFVGRLNGSDFILVIPDQPEDMPAVGQKILASLYRICRDMNFENVTFLASSSAYHSGEHVSSVMRRIDSVLESAAEKDTDICVYIDNVAPEICKISPQNWQVFLSTALKEKRFELECFPVYSNKSELLHVEAPVRLIQEDKTLLRAGRFMPHLSRLGLGVALDLIVLDLAITQTRKTQIPIGINLSASLLAHEDAIDQMVARITQHKDIAHQLWLEVPEYGAFQNIDGFRRLCEKFHSLPCHIGIEHLGLELSHIGELHDLGLHYIKIDRAFIHDIDTVIAQQIFVRGLCSIVHSIGLLAIAEGVQSEEEWKMLIELGIDGGTGEYFPRIDQQPLE